MKKIRVLLVAPLVLGFGLFIATGAQGTEPGCLDPEEAATEAFFEALNFANAMSETLIWEDERLCHALGKDLQKLCTQVAIKQLQCLQRVRAATLRVGRRACAVYEGEAQDMCLDEVADIVADMSDSLAGMKSELKYKCAIARLWFVDDQCLDDAVDD
jgi:hypothetical protein